MVDRKIEELVRQFRQRMETMLGGSLEVILYGSYARGQASEDSDIDLLVILPYRNSQVENLLDEAAWEIGFQAGKVLSVIPVGKDELPLLQASPFFQNVQREGILI
ncbi:MAG: nucleotidyltransferase domain-containing protein [Thermoguttaceae bacterium]|nr:nucleotidyltransferase domain-containing protein [Thermoguttaceae bacterium]MDW8037908.1 nucleotidyltransferase domain-containing protein [Thermoguttaceae bacterium]